MVCFAILLVNLWLMYKVCLRLSESREVALLATLLVTYHAWMVNLYYSTGTIYELLCFAFYCAAFELPPGDSPGRQEARLAAVAAVSRALHLRAQFQRTGGDAAALCTVLRGDLAWLEKQRAYGHDLRAGNAALCGRGNSPGSPNSLAITNPALCRPAISAGKYLHTFHLYLNVLFYQDHFFRDANTILLVAAMLTLAIWRRSRTLLFTWLFILFSMLPFIFIPHYSGFFLYLPMVGWALYAATGLEMLRFHFARALPSAVLFFALALALAPLHARESRKSMQVFTSAELPTNEMIAELKRVQPKLPAGAHVFFASDPFPAKTFSLLFLVRELYRDQSIDVARAKDGDPAEGGNFDAVFQWVDGRLDAGKR